MNQATGRTSPSLDQQRARHAWDAVERLKVGSEEADDYAREAKKLPVRIITAGLGQALSFIHAKKDKKKGLVDLHEDLTDWARQRLPAVAKHRSLLEAVIHSDSEFLRRATDEIIAYLGWLDRFTEAGIAKENGERLMALLPIPLPATERSNRRIQNRCPLFPKNWPPTRPPWNLSPLLSWLVPTNKKRIASSVQPHSGAFCAGGGARCTPAMWT